MMSKRASAKLVRGILIVAFVIGFSLLQLSAWTFPKTASAETGSVTYVGVVQSESYHGWTQSTRYMEVDGQMAICCQHFSTTPAQGSPTTVIEGVVGNDDMRKVLWYGYGGPGDQGYNLVSTACALSVANGTDVTDLGSDTLSDITWRPSPPASFVVTKWSTGNATQSVCTWNYTPNGYMDLQKVSEFPSITNDNSCYSLDGACYCVCTDYYCDNQVATLITDSNGHAAAIEIPAGRYYVKETKAPKGFLKDETTYVVDVPSGKTVHVGNNQVVDSPLRDPAWALVNKFDFDTGEADPQGAATLSGGQFTIKYYDAILSTEDLSWVETTTPKRTWIVETDEDGFAALEDDYKISGDSLYHGANGHIIIPIGTVTIQETKAPDGYLLADGDTGKPPALSAQVINGNELGTTIVFNPIKVPEMTSRGDIAIMKYGETQTNPDKDPEVKTPLAGVAFDILNRTGGDVMRGDGTIAVDGEVVARIVTDEQGYATTENIRRSGWIGALAIGDYEVVEDESTIPDGYAKDAPFHVTVVGGGHVERRVLEDKIGTAVRIVKHDSQTDRIVKGETKFRILDADNNPIEFTSYYPVKTTQTEFTTDASGSCVLPEKLMPGTYRLEELSAPWGYLINAEPVEFVVDGTTVNTFSDPLEIAVADDPAMGTITVSKTDSETGAVVEGATYDVYASKDIVTQDGTVRAHAGDMVDDVKTGADGKATTTSLYLGTYEVKETATASGYALDANPHDVELAYAGQHVAVVEEMVNVTDTQTKIIIEKTRSGSGQHVPGAQFECWDVSNEVDVNHDAGYGKVAVTLSAPDKVKGAKLLLYAAEDIVSAEGDVLHKKGALVGELDDTREGYFESENVDCGSYVLAIRQASSESEEYKTSTLATVIVNGDSPVSCVRVEGVQVDDGIKWTAREIPAIVDAASIYHASSNEEGMAVFSGIASGTYGLMETRPADGYVLDPTVRYVTVDENGLIQNEPETTIEVENDYTKIVISKVDSDTGAELPGNTLRIYKAPDLESGEEYGDLIEEWVSSGEPHEIDALPAGLYVLHEEQPLKGYLKAEDIKFSVLETGNPQHVEMRNDYTKLAVSKIDSATGKGLLGAHLALRADDGTWVDPRLYVDQESSQTRFETFATDDDGNPLVNGEESSEKDGDEDGPICWETEEDPIKFDGLDPGSYTLVEIDAPEGYLLADDVGFDLPTDGQQIKITMEDSPEDPSNMPKTGDSINALWILGAIVAALVPVVAISLALGDRGPKEDHSKKGGGR